MNNADRYRILAGMLREARVNAGLSQMAMAELLGFPQTVVSRLEQGTRRLDMVEAIVFCQKLGLDAEEFLGEFLRRAK